MFLQARGKGIIITDYVCDIYETIVIFDDTKGSKTNVPKQAYECHLLKNQLFLIFWFSLFYLKPMKGCLIIFQPWQAFLTFNLFTGFSQCSGPVQNRFNSHMAAGGRNHCLPAII